MSCTVPGRIVIVAGPSGAGKSTVVARLPWGQLPVPMNLAVSATTRAPRPGEQDGVDYHFLTPEQFALKREAGEFIECFEVFGSGQWYGTLKAPLATSISSGKWVLLEIDVQGAQEVARQFSNSITIFVRPDSLDELDHRLRRRGTESEEALQQRLATARTEWAFQDQFQHVIINQSVDEAVEHFVAILHQHAEPVA